MRTRSLRRGTTGRAFRRCSAGDRATVCSLSTSVDAISRLLLPEARRRSTSSSRSDSPCWSVVAGEVRVTSGAAPSRSNNSRAASSSSRPASSSPSMAGRSCNQLACSRDFVRGVEVEPETLCAPQADECRRRLPLGERDCAFGGRDDRVQHRAVVPLRKLPQLRACFPGVVDLAGSKADLDAGGSNAARLSGSVISAHDLLIAASATSRFPCASRS